MPKYNLKLKRDFLLDGVKISKDTNLGEIVTNSLNPLITEKEQIIQRVKNLTNKDVSGNLWNAVRGVLDTIKK